MSSVIIPSNAGKKSCSDTVELVRERLTDALRPFFNGKKSEDRLSRAVDASVDSIVGLITTMDVSGREIGAVVMTEAASIKNEHTGEFNSRPRKL